MPKGYMFVLICSPALDKTHFHTQIPLSIYKFNFKWVTKDQWLFEKGIQNARQGQSEQKGSKSKEQEIV